VTENYRIGSHGQPIPNHEPELIATLDEDGKLNVEVRNMRSNTHTKKLLRDFDKIESMIGKPLTDEQKQKLNEARFEVQKESGSVTVFRQDRINIIPEFQYRSIANTAMKVLSYYAPEIARDKVFDNIKRFIKNGGEDYLHYACIADTLKRATLFQNQYGSIKANSVEIYFSPQLNKVVAVVTILSTIRRAIILSDRIPSIMSQREFSILRTLEPLDHNGKLNAETITLPIDIMSPQIITLSERKPDEKYMNEEVADFIDSQYKIEPALANLLKKLKEKVINNSLSNSEAGDVIFELIINFVDESLRREKFKVETSDISEKLNECGLKTLIPKVLRSGKYNTSEQLLQELLPPIYCTMGKFREILLSNDL
jgi:hypothetical protein